MAKTQTDDRPEAEAALMAALHRAPRVVIKADLLPAVSVLSFVALVGVPVGWVWSRLAPPIKVLIPGGGGAPADLPEESFHTFDGIAILSLLGLGAGLVIGAVVWSLRGRRGPVVMIGAVIGSVIAGWLATQLGASFANALYPPGSPAAGAVLTQAPQPSSWTILPWAFGVALVYGTLSVWNGMQDLGRRLG